MENKFKSAFGQIHAEDALKSKTKAFIYEKTNGYDRKKRVNFQRAVMSMACLLIAVVGIFGYFSYTIPVVAISIDINPSIELEINRYDKVIDVKGYNDDGIRLAGELDIQNMDYSSAINAVMENQTVVSCLNDNNVLEITISGNSEKAKEKMQSCISDKTNVEQKYIHCYGNKDDIEAAHSAGLSVGKYRAYLELKEENPDITPEDVSGLTMREIRDITKDESSDNADDCSGVGQQHGNGNGHGNGQGNGKRYGKN